jgi:exodeoxyribonuclease-1
MIYSGGFFGDSDRSLMNTVRATNPRDLERLDLPFRDRRLQDMLFRYRARNYRETLNQDELAQWHEFRMGRLNDEHARVRYERDMQIARNTADKKTSEVLDALHEYVEGLRGGTTE